MPVVAISGHQRVAGVTNIELDHARAAELALEHLKALGHRRIAVIRGVSYSADSGVRWRTIRDTARRLGIPIEPKLVTELTEYDLTPGPGYRATKALLANGGPFTALFAFNDVIAIGAIQALNDASLDVPRDVSVVGFDDIPGAMYHRPGLTTVRQPLRLMGETAARTLLSQLERSEWQWRERESGGAGVHADRARPGRAGHDGARAAFLSPRARSSPTGVCWW